MEIAEVIAGFFAQYSSLAVLGLVLAEWLILFISHQIESNKESFVSVLSYIIESIPYILLAKIAIVTTMFFMYEHRFFELGFEWYVWIMAFMIYDFVVWAIHYAGHRVRILWCIHGVHHTAEEMNLSVVARGSVFDFLFSTQNYIWLPLLGIHPLMLFIFEPAGRLFATFSHISETIVGKMPILEKLLVTPSVHRVHHSRNHIYLDRNFGETFSIWDHIFRTFQTEVQGEKFEYGIIHDSLNSKSLLQVQFLMWKDLFRDVKKAPTLRDKVNYLFKPPGWNHIDGGKDADVYRDEAWENRTRNKGKAAIPSSKLQMT